MTRHFDLIVIGAGPGGYEIAARVAGAGQSVALIERDRLGGTCLNRGCIPTKCLCASADVLDAVRRSADYGIDVQSFSVSYPRAVERMNAIVSELRDGIAAVVSKCTVFNGEARFAPDGSVIVGNDILTADRVIIATGSRPAALNIPGAELAMSSDDFLRLTELPQSMVVIGGGVIGLELASVAATFGCAVTVIEYCKEVLPAFDSEVAKRLRACLGKRGVVFKVGAAVKSVSRDGAVYCVDYEDKKGLQSVNADAVLMAVGRRAVLPEGLADAGIEVNDRGFIRVNDRMETTRPGVFAVGDCNGLMMLAHAASAQAGVAMGRNINLYVVPADVFTSPEVAMVGLTADAAKALADPDVVVRKAFFRANGKAVADGHTDGFVKVIVNTRTDRLLGCHIIGPHAADLVQEAALAIAADIPLSSLTPGTIHAHPTLGETLAAALC